MLWFWLCVVLCDCVGDYEGTLTVKLSQLTYVTNDTRTKVNAFSVAVKIVAPESGPVF